MQYFSAQQIAEKWGISKRRVQVLCTENRIKNAIRIGNMWAIPENAQKPTDGRVHTTCASVHPTAREARTALKRLTADSYQKIISNLDHPGTAKMVFVSLFATEMFCNLQSAELSGQKSDVYCMISAELLGRERKTGQFLDDYSRFAFMFPDFQQYICRYSEYTDDILSWAYQYVNKISLDSGLESTQFFTERYMIAYLTDDIKVDSAFEHVYLDPACGGGNFLSYILERLYSLYIPNFDDAAICLQHVLEVICGYELDSDLAGVASVNLKLKALMLLSAIRPVYFKDWQLFCPNIFASTVENKVGFLEADFESHNIRRIADGKPDTLSGLVKNVTAIYTNPPFQTVKGMDEHLKEHLKTFFPDAKCDLCNAFLLQCMDKVRPGGTVGIVTQSSWLYLDSFVALRKQIMDHYTIDSLADLGAGAFYDLSGEKANVALVRFRKSQPVCNTVKMLSLRNIPLEEKDAMLSQPGDSEISVEQAQLFAGEHAAFSLNRKGQNRLLSIVGRYGDYGTPMQGTSTGNAAELIAYYWEHWNDPEWVPVSKGGGYSRWCGLNSYVLKWGTDGEYIRKTKGSALRNTKYFGRTAVVYSDTGTSGFNARLLEKGQVFVASGPGIRDVQGSSYAHLALLNSRIFSYCLRGLSPKLTVAAGYISRVPVPEHLLDLPVIGKLGRECYRRKRGFLQARPNNLEWTVPGINTGTVKAYASQLFLREMQDELVKLTCEAKLDSKILCAYAFDHLETEELNEAVGIPAAALKGDGVPSDLDMKMAQALDVNCQIIRTRANKQSLGCDGLLEWIARKEMVSPQKIIFLIRTQPDMFVQCQAKYTDLVLHNIVLSCLGFRTSDTVSELPALRKRFLVVFPALNQEWNMVEEWICSRFNLIHTQSLSSRPYYRYEDGKFEVNV